METIIQSTSGQPGEPPRLRGFDDFKLRLGDIMRGERATLGKSLLDVQRELKIKAAYIAAIENCDPSAFETRGFVAGYVRSYARYLGLEPDRTYAEFCRESGFQSPDGMSLNSLSAKALKPATGEHRAGGAFADPDLKFLPLKEPSLGHIDLSALGSVAVLLALIAGISFGGWTVLRELQRVNLIAGEDAPDGATVFDPLASGFQRVAQGAAQGPAEGDTRRGDALTRLYRPEALDIPILEPRDGPIAAVNPQSYGVFAAVPPDVARARTAPQPPPETAPDVQVIGETMPELFIVAARPAWVRVRGADGSLLLEKVLDAGERFEIPAMEEPPVLKVGESGALYFAVDGTHYGPAGANGVVTNGIVLEADALSGRYEVADLTDDHDLARVVAGAALPPLPQ